MSNFFFSHQKNKKIKKGKLISKLFTIFSIFTVQINWLNELNEKLYNHTKILKDYIKNEMEKLGWSFVYFENDKKEKIPTKLTFPNESLEIPKESILNNKTFINFNEIVTFRLYTLKTFDKYEILKFNDTDNLFKSHFNIKQPTLFITHGYLTSANGPSCTLIRNGNIVNILIIFNYLSKNIKLFYL